MAVPYTFANTPGGASIPLSHLDDDFAYVTTNTPLFAMQAMTITVANTFPALSYTPAFGLFLLIVNGTTFTTAGSPATFSVSGTSITWLSTIWSVNPGDTVVAVYTHQ
jgi:hypothetical protein